MGAVKHALLEVEDFVSGCLQEGRTLNQTIRDAKEEHDKPTSSNPYLLDANFIEDKYYQFRGQRWVNIKDRLHGVWERCF